MSMYLDPPTEKQYDWNQEHKPGQFPGGFYLKQPDVYLQDPFYYLSDALEAGFNKFILSMYGTLGTGQEALSFMRANTLHSGIDVRFILMDRHGGSEYSVFSTYDKPLAVYPVWSGNDNFEDLFRLVEHPVGEDERIYNNPNIPLNLRPVAGQPHKVIIRQPMYSNEYKMNPVDRQVEKDRFAVTISNMQKAYPKCDLIFTGSTRFDVLFAHGFGSVGYKLHTEADIGWTPLVCLPNGKMLVGDEIWDARFADWFEVVGWEQKRIDSREKATKFALSSLQWASRYFNNVTPFVHNISSRKNILSPEFWEARTTDFKLPPSRRNLMRNTKLDLSEYDRFLCDTCILQNNCKLFRQGAVCIVKGSEGVGLADSFGTRDSNKLIDGLVKLTKLQAERLEDSIKAEEDAGVVNPEVTKQFNQLFANGVKLAKILDPSLNGGPSVNVNVGVGVNTAGAIGSANPRQVVAGIIAELEASGIPRDKITNEMIQGVLTNMGTVGSEVAKATIAVGSHVEKYDAPKALPATPAPDDGVKLSEFFGYDSTIVEGKVVENG